jgi:hypothetical protein
MTPLLRDLLWSIVLVSLLVLGLDWHEKNIAKRQEVDQIQRLVERNMQRGQNIDWPQLQSQALQAQKQWLTLFAPVESNGKFRAQALEALGDLCAQAEVQCRLSVVGESAQSVSLSTSTSTSQKPNEEPAILERVPSQAVAPDAASIMSAVSKVSLPLQGESVIRFLAAIENSDQLRVVEKLSARGIAADLQVRSFGMSKEVLQTLKRDNDAALKR